MIFILERDVFISTHVQNIGLRYLVYLFGLRYLGHIPVLQLFLLKMSSTGFGTIKPRRREVFIFAAREVAFIAK